MFRDLIALKATRALICVLLPAQLTVARDCVVARSVISYGCRRGSLPVRHIGIGRLTCCGSQSPRGLSPGDPKQRPSQTVPINATIPRQAIQWPNRAHRGDVRCGDIAYNARRITQQKAATVDDGAARFTGGKSTTRRWLFNREYLSCRVRDPLQWEE